MLLLECSVPSQDPHMSWFWCVCMTVRLKKKRRGGRGARTGVGWQRKKNNPHGRVSCFARGILHFQSSFLRKCSYDSIILAESLTFLNGGKRQERESCGAARFLSPIV